ncbi:MAG: hypothetical protein OXB88_04165 [Bacteriovoracales bacterium]|nr:hypothetical protein [Bacteriovoracales bacterium]
MKKDKPWLDERGEMRPDTEITELGKYWSQDTWRRYLNADSYRKKKQGEKLLHESEYVPQGLLDIPRSILTKKLRVALNLLTPEQRLVVEGVLQDKPTHLDAITEPWRVERTKSRALFDLKKKLCRLVDVDHARMNVLAFTWLIKRIKNDKARRPSSCLNKQKERSHA